MPPSSTVRANAISSMRKAISPASPTQKSEIQPKGDPHHVEQSHSPYRNHWNGCDRRELDRTVSRQGIAGRRDGRRAKRRSRAEEVRGDRLAGAQAIGPLARSVAVES